MTTKKYRWVPVLPPGWDRVEPPIAASDCELCKSYVARIQMAEYYPAELIRQASIHYAEAGHGYVLPVPE
jgi:hypothetical protein